MGPAEPINHSVTKIFKSGGAACKAEKLQQKRAYSKRRNKWIGSDRLIDRYRGLDKLKIEELAAREQNHQQTQKKTK